MRRRDFIAASAASFTCPAAMGASRASVLRFIPQGDLAATDPHFVANYVTRNHSYLVFDTLYGLDANYVASPQMVEGHVVEQDGLQWRLTLRPGMLWHDGEPVLARDCVASIRRWGGRDSYGKLLLSATAELTAPDDRTVLFRLSRPFPRLPNALAKSNPLMPAMMPERLARLPPAVSLPEAVGSGPFRFVADERVPGALVAYERFARYRPRSDGVPERTAGPKVVHLDRVEWHVIPDPSTAASALRAGERDWWEYAAQDLLPVLRRAANLRVTPQDRDGAMSILRLNHLHPPFDDPRIRRALLWAMDQRDFMQAVAGTDPAMWHAGVGMFTPGTPMASEAGMEPLTAPRDPARAAREIRAAGYSGQPVVLMVPTDMPALLALGEVGADVLRRTGLNVDYQAMDWGTLSQRRTKRDPVAQGGWNAFFSGGAGSDFLNPIVNTQLVADPATAFYGWPDSPRAEALRLSWLDAPDLPAQQKVAAALQVQAMEDVLYVPLGQYQQMTAYRKDLTGVLEGLPVFWNLNLP